MRVRPLFSILHTSARPDAWRAVFVDWMAKAKFPELVEYVLCVDARWGFTPLDARSALEETTAGTIRVVENEGRRCYVDGVNTAARAATGQILIVNADDQFACEGWDVEILQALGYRSNVPAGDAAGLIGLPGSGRSDFVVEVSTGTPDEHSRGIMVMPILSRARYERLGYVFYPAYESMYADNDFAGQARADGSVVDARGLLFPHRHPLFDVSVKIDRQYQAQNRREAFRLGAALFECRQKCGFADVSAVDLVASLEKAVSAATAGAGDADRTATFGDGRVVALCLSGENFRGEWFDAMLTLYTHLIAVRGFNVIRLRNYTTNVYVTRLEVWEALEGAEVRPDLLLWVDDDNTVTPEQFDRLLETLDARNDADVVGGWCWVHDAAQSRFQPSCGNWAPDGSHWLPFDAVEWMNATELRAVEVTGFPCLLMRGSLLGKLGPRPFLRGILDARLKHGIGGEDLAFCRSCRAMGSQILIDPQVRVPHLKYMQVLPEFYSEGDGRGASVSAAGHDERGARELQQRAPRLAVTLRVRNEGRWIERCVRSFLALGPVYVMDDHSTDNTVELAARAGAIVWPSPFDPLDLDERRDKNYLLDRVKEHCAPEWIFAPDGDEELQRGGAEKILRACASGAADAYAVRFLYLWDGPTRARVDRWYSTFSRFSLFRVRDGLAFKSLYEGKGVHAGLHTGNAPGGVDIVQTKTAVLNVFLLHYGYMLRADRIRKYEYYNRVDPGNQLEDCYRHVVQGDLPEVPASEWLLHAGPLDVRELPASVAPEGWPAEWEALVTV